MTDSVVIYAGTAPAGTGLELLRKQADEIGRLERRLRTIGPDRDLEAVLEHVRHSVFVRVFDVDTTANYRINQPPTDAVPTWPIDTFVACPLPGPSLIDRIVAGVHGGRFPYLNVDGIRAVQAGADASGGIRPNGWFIGETNRTSIDGHIREGLQRIIQRRRRQAGANPNPIRVVLITSSLGGFGSGVQELLTHRALRIAQEFGVQVTLLRILLLPGTNRSKDPANAFSTTHALIKELAAHATGYHWHFERNGEGDDGPQVRSPYIPTVLLSDTNNASGKPKGLSIENFAGLVAEVLRGYLLTPLGDRIDAPAQDFNVRTQELTDAGEPRAGRTLGYSSIYLDRQRILNFAKAAYADQLLTHSLMPITDDNVTGHVRSYCEVHHLVEGGGIRDLTNRLLDRSDGRHGFVDVERFRETYSRNTADLAGMKLLRQGSDRLTLTVQQVGDHLEAFERRARDVAEAADADLKRRTSTVACSYDSGFEAARQFVAGTLVVLDNMVLEATKETQAFEDAVNQYRAVVDEYEQNFIPTVERWNVIARFLRRGRINSAAQTYRRHLEELHVRKMERDAHLQAIRVLNDIAEHTLKPQLAVAQRAVDNIVIVRDGARAETDRLGAATPDYGCPVGFPLVQQRGDLDDYYQLVLPEGDPGETAARAYSRIFATVDRGPLELASDVAALNTRVAERTNDLFRDKVEQLHVVAELRRRIPDREELGRLLRARIDESVEFVQLRDSCDLENGVYVIRLFGADTAHLGDLGELLNQYDRPRGVKFEVVDTADPERLMFVQYRAAFPLSDWAHFPRSRQIYNAQHKRSAFEKAHVSPGARFLPTPGERLSVTASGVVAFKAWSLARLEFNASSGLWDLLSADGVELPVPLGAQFEELREREGYRRAVDVISAFNVAYIQSGPEHVRAKLDRLLDIQGGRSKPADASEERLAVSLDEDVVEAIEHELEWWRRNLVPAATAWGSTANKTGSKTTASAGTSVP